jgi:molybdopterin converting factor small subunit
MHRAAGRTSQHALAGATVRTLAGIIDFRLIVIVAIAAAAAGLAFAGAYFLSQESDSMSPTAETASTIAIVNGKEITRGDVLTIQQSFASQGQQMSEHDAIEYSIDREVLVQEAERQGFSLSAQQAEEMLEVQLAQQGGTIEDLREQLSRQGQSYEEALEGYRLQVEIQQYLESAVDVPPVSPSEVREFYEQNKEQLAVGGDVPEYEAVETDIESFLELQKQQEAVLVLIDQLRSKADIVYS